MIIPCSDHLSEAHTHIYICGQYVIVGEDMWSGNIWHSFWRQQLGQWYKLTFQNIIWAQYKTLHQRQLQKRDWFVSKRFCYPRWMQHAWWRNQDLGPPGFLLQPFGYDSNENSSTVAWPRKHVPCLKFEPSSFWSYCWEKFTLVVVLVESDQAQNPKGPSRRNGNALQQRPLMSPAAEK